jgi:hypothetical protein
MLAASAMVLVVEKAKRCQPSGRRQGLKSSKISKDGRGIRNMNEQGKKLLLPMAVSLGLAFVGAAATAGEPKPTCDPKTEECEICHNIGGPRELGANCDGATGECTFTLEGGGTVTIPRRHFLGILIPVDSAGAIAAHLAHGDGLTLLTFDPPLHLASTGQIHKASNVECLARRAITTQPPEPGN